MGAALPGTGDVFKGPEAVAGALLSVYGSPVLQASPSTRYQGGTERGTFRSTFPRDLISISDAVHTGP